ncbi:histidine triad nucleotide-binding protein [uncultured Gimesia sp.]|jgi:histidine triad (HIT) family protein|uniref:histidine triad nucleotide-binding protein n=1 Tax=uncultured Gimesia sp. TaxID=1678688 RepID=UPI0026110EC3|nr:histidine triad nucleotide-binding protein [uncultured Gimesia sp.]
MSGGKTIFKKIIDREIPAEIIYEDELCLAFKDVNPQAPVHVLVIPKQEIPSMAHLEFADQELAGHLILTVGKLATMLGLENGYRMIVNTGTEGGQTVDHLHLHLLGGRSMHWPPG